MEIFIMLIAMIVGGLASWQIFNWYYRKKLQSDSTNSVTESTVLLEKIEKVFKIILAEGQFTEIYDHQTKKDIWGFFNSNKKALLVSKAKISVGYDFAKIKFNRDTENRKLIIEYFPEPEILSIDTDYKFYDIEQGWLNKFSTEDYTKILAEAKKTMQEKALQSELPDIASKQIGLMMTQLGLSMGWEIEASKQIEAKMKFLKY